METGISSRTTTCSGKYSLLTPRPARNSRSVATVTAAVPGRSVTAAQTRSPNVRSGTAMAATSATEGCAATSVSTAAALMFFPPRMMRSALRPATRT